MSKRKILLSETRKNILYVQQLRSWLDELPQGVRLRDIGQFDGEITLRWEEER